MVYAYGKMRNINGHKEENLLNMCHRTYSVCLEYRVMLLQTQFFISKFAGADGITVLNLVLPVFNVIFAVGSMIGVGSAIRFKILRAKNNERADDYFFKCNNVCVPVKHSIYTCGTVCTR